MSFSYKEYVNPVFKNLTLNIDTSWKLGLIGRNGRGKSTLLKLINGDLQPDKGMITKQIQTEIFPYSYKNKYKRTYDIVLENMGNLKSIEEQMERLSGDTDPESLLEYNNLLSIYLENGGYTAESRIKKELHLFELSEDLLWRDFSSLSGGEQSKILLLALFLRSNCFVLLDEPSNHLDISGRRALASYLKKKQGFIIASHDRELLDTVTDHIVSINRNNITLERGNYTSWRNNFELNEQFELRTKEKLEREIKRLEDSAQKVRKWSGIIEQKRSEFAGNARGYDTRSASLMRRAKASENRLKVNLEEKKNLLKNYEPIMELQLEQEKALNCLIKIDNISFSYGNKAILKNFSIEINAGDIVWIKGKNGIGKSTLLKLISGILSPQSGIIIRQENLAMAISYQDYTYTSGFVSDLISTKDELLKCKRICGDFGISEEQFLRPLETFSNGELKKFDIARAMAEKNSLLILDEPLNYMDTYFREQLHQAILKYQPTMIFVEHDEKFASSIANKVVLL